MKFGRNIDLKFTDGVLASAVLRVTSIPALYIAILFYISSISTLFYMLILLFISSNPAFYFMPILLLFHQISLFHANPVFYFIQSYSLFHSNYVLVDPILSCKRQKKFAKAGLLGSA